MGALIGFDIGGTKIVVVAGRAGADGLTVLGRVSFPTEPVARPWRDFLSTCVGEARGQSAKPPEPASRAPGRCSRRAAGVSVAVDGKGES